MAIGLHHIPSSPGIYFFINKNGEIIYIGKAKNLKNRVKSYWRNTTELTGFKQQMVQEISKVQYTIVDNELESLLLEAESIKKHQPKYNIVLKDDKNWGYILISDEEYPKITVVHGRQRRRGQYFGPYTSTLAARIILQFLRRILPIQTSGKIYLKYQDQPLTSSEYLKIIKQAKDILKGKTKQIAQELLSEIKTASQKQNYELAKIKRNQYQALARLQQRQKIISHQSINQDIINFAILGQQIAITLMQVRKGVLGDKFNFLIQNQLDLKNSEVLENFINQFYSTRVDKPLAIILPAKINRSQIILAKNIKIIIPQKGKAKQLLDLVYKNAEDYLKNNLTDAYSKNLLNLQKLLRLPSVPRRIEIYDISNIQGRFAVGSMVVFTDGRIDSDQYRIFNIKNIKGANDVWMLRQVLERRSKHTEWLAPDLIILDGGKPQLNTVYPVLPASWQNKVIALAKRQEEIFLPHQKTAIKLPLHNPLSLMLQNMRNQAHKFAIKNYRKRHSKNL